MPAVLEIRVGSLSLTGQIPEEQAVDLKIVPNNELQTSKPIGSPAVVLDDRGNDQHAISFGIWREHLDDAGFADPRAATHFLLKHLVDVRAIGVSYCSYMVDQLGTYYFVPAFARVTECRKIGCSTFHQYLITCGELTDHPPTSGGGGGVVGTF